MKTELWPRLVRGFVSAMLFTGMAVGVISFRFFMDGKRFVEEAEQMQRFGAPWRNVVSRYEDAAKTYFPGNPFPEQALWKLSMMAKSAEMRGEFERQRYIWEVIRRSAVSQRHLFQPYQSYVTEANIALVRRSTPPQAGPRSVGDGLADPGIGATILMFFGLLLWIGSAAASIFAMLPQAFYFLCVSGVGMIIWMGAAWLA